MDQKTPSLAEVRARIDAVDTELLRLVGERASLAGQVAVAKAAAGDGGKFALRPAREAQVLRALLTRPHGDATNAVIIRIWRELMADSLARQGPFTVTAWGGKDLARALELTRLRFGVTPPLKLAAKPEDALASAKTPGGVAVLALSPDSNWWGRLLAEPRIKVFASLPCLKAWGPMAALAVADVDIEPSGGDETFWVTDATADARDIETVMSNTDIAARLVAQSGGLKLFSLAGFFQSDDARLQRAPGDLKGVIGAAATPFDL